MTELTLGTLMYRYEDCYYSDHESSTSELHVSVYVIVKKTKCGYWVVPKGHEDAYKEAIELKTTKHMYSWAKPKFVLSEFDGKRLCYPTLEQAMNSYVKRKARQILLTTHTLRKAEQMLRIAKRMSDKPLVLSDFTKSMLGMREDTDVPF